MRKVQDDANEFPADRVKSGESVTGSVLSYFLVFSLLVLIALAALVSLGPGVVEFSSRVQSPFN